MHFSSIKNYPLLALFLSLSLIFIATQSRAHAGDIEKGKTSVQQKLCKICHSFNGEGGQVGPELRQVGIRRSREWLEKWLKDPRAMKPDTPMPAVPWREGEMEDVIEYLLSLKKEVKKEEALKLPDPRAGEKLVEMYDCRACHKIREGGRVRFPDLTDEASRHDEQWLNTWLKDPQAVKPGTFMPTFPFTDEEREAVVKYLLSPK